MKVLSDVKSIILYQTIAASSSSGLKSNDLNGNLRLASKQLYSRVSSLVNAGLVRKQRGRYSLTSYGRIIGASMDIMNKASFNYHKLVAIDTIEESNVNNGMPEEERKKIVQVLIQNRQIKDILLNGSNMQPDAANNETEVQCVPSRIPFD
jgi:DNA-binding HxlR family transcriptional regulator